MLRIMLLFAFLGPAIGSFAFLGAEFAMVPTPAGATLSDSLIVRVIATVFFGLWGLVIAIPMGVIPGAATGISYWFVLKTTTHENPKWPFRLAIGTVLGFVVATTYGFAATWGSRDSSFSVIALLWSGPGAIASALCAIVVSRTFYESAFPERGTDA
jgi:hypothetical protein